MASTAYSSNGGCSWRVAGGADFHPDLQPAAGDIVLLPHKGTDVFRTDLPDHLARLGTTHVVIAGMTANLCCESTGRHAAEEGYDVTFLSDAIGSENIPSYEAAVRVNFPLIGNAVIPVDEFLAAVGVVEQGKVRKGARARLRSPGDRDRDRARACDGHPRRLYPGDVGLLFRATRFIPLDAVTRCSAGTVFKLYRSRSPTMHERPLRGG